MSLQVRLSSGSSSEVAWSLYKCAAFWRAVYVSLKLKLKPGTIREEKGISLRFRVSISSRYDPSCWKQRKKKLPSVERMSQSISNPWSRYNSSYTNIQMIYTVLVDRTRNLAQYVGIHSNQHTLTLRCGRSLICHYARYQTISTW